VLAVSSRGKGGVLRKTPTTPVRAEFYHLFYGSCLTDSAIAALKPVFWLEAGALWAFGISRFIQGETLLMDPSVMK
jgi:hypothetical protein